MACGLSQCIDTDLTAVVLSAGQAMKLNGAGAYQAAVHCATISAAKRIRMWQQQQRRQPSSGRLLLPDGTCTEPMH